jgi:hypothetical protein
VAPLALADLATRPALADCGMLAFITIDIRHFRSFVAVAEKGKIGA